MQPASEKKKQVRLLREKKLGMSLTGCNGMLFKVYRHYDDDLVILGPIINHLGCRLVIVRSRRTNKNKHSQFWWTFCTRRFFHNSEKRTLQLAEFANELDVKTNIKLYCVQF